MLLIICQELSVQITVNYLDTMSSLRYGINYEGSSDPLWDLGNSQVFQHWPYTQNLTNHQFLSIFLSPSQPLSPLPPIQIAFSLFLTNSINLYQQSNNKSVSGITNSMETGCMITRKDGATKICISEKCDLSNRFICEECEERHEHEGSLIAVRIKKIEDIMQTIQNNKQSVNRKLSQANQTFQMIKNFINTYTASLAHDDNILTDLHVSLHNYFQASQNSEIVNFSELWKKIRENQSVIYQKDAKLSEMQKINHLKQIMEGMSQSQKLKVVSKQESLFVEKFSGVFSFLNVQLRSSLRNQTIQSLIELTNTFESQETLISKSQGMCIAKILELCQYDKKAQKIYNKLLEVNPFDAQILNWRALLRKKMMKYEEACQDFTQLITLLQQKIPNPTIYLQQRAQIYQKMNSWEKAQKDLLKCIKSDNNSSSKKELQLNLIDVYQKQQKYEAAIQQLKSVIEQEKGDKIQLYKKMVAYAKKIGNKEVQNEFMGLLYAQKTQDLQSLLERAPKLHSQGRYEDAIADYTTILEKVKDNAGLYYNRALSYFMINKKKEAISDLQISRKLDPKFKNPLSLLAGIFFQESQSESISQQLRKIFSEKSLACYEELLKEEKNHLYWHNIGILVMKTNPQKAYNAYNSAIEIKPDFIPSYLGKIKSGLIYGEKPESVLKDVYQVIALGNRTTNIFYIKSTLEQELNQPTKALQTIELVLQADPSKSQYIQTKIRLLLKLQKNQEAVSQVNRLYSLYPQIAKKYLKQPPKTE